MVDIVGGSSAGFAGGGGHLDEAQVIMTLAEKVASVIVRRNPGFEIYRDDMVGAACLGLLEFFQHTGTPPTAGGLTYQVAYNSALMEANKLAGNKRVGAGYEPRDFIPLESVENILPTEGPNEDSMLRKIDIQKGGIPW